MNLKQGLKRVWIVPAVFAADRISKRICLAVLSGGSQPLIPGVLSLHFVRNSGIAFSMLSGIGWITIVLTGILLCALVWYQLKNTELDALTRIGLWLIVGGGIGNLYDRIFYGSVIDFIRVDLFRFAIFNIADIFVCIGCAMAVLAIFINYCKERKNRGI